MSRCSIESSVRSTGVRIRIVTAFLALLLVMAARDGRAQDEPLPSPPVPAPKRPVIGIALGGGSARGMAHAGVLRWLEEHHIPIDRIAGNSTGAFMSAAYATGLSSAEIRSMLRLADWQTILRPDIAYPLRSYRRKEDDRDFSIKLEAGLRHGFRLQSGLNPGHYLGMLISRVLLPYSDVSNFDDLPIPFRCVATDLENGDVVVFDHGPIAGAVRASMSIPGTFDPVRLNRRLIADGGILNNIPVDIAEKMGSDVVIAVRTGPKADERPEETIGGVAKRAITLMMQSLEKPKLREADVVIIPNLDGLTGGDFDKSDEFAERGYAAAELQKEALMRYALGDADWAAYRASIDARKKPRTDAISFVEVTGVAERAATEIAQQLSRHIGKKQNISSIEDDLNRIIGLGRYASATYTRVLDESAMGLGVSVRDKSYGPPFVRFGLQTNNENEDINLAVGARVTLMDVTGVGSEWRFDGTLGSTLAFTTEWYQPLTGARPIHGGAFLSPHAGYSRTTESLYADHDLAAIYGQQRLAAGMDLGWNSGGDTRFRIGYEAAHVRNVIRVGEPVLPATTGGEQSLRARFDSDGQNAAYLASHGVRFSSTARWFLNAPDARKEFGLVEASFLAATTAGRGNILSVSMEGGFSLSTTPPLLYQFSLGGPFRLGGFPTYAFRGPKYFLGGLGLKVPIGRLPPLLGGRVYLDSLVEAGSVFTDPTNARVKLSFTTGFAADTFLGPFFAGGSIGSDGNVRVYFLIGRIVR